MEVQDELNKLGDILFKFSDKKEDFVALDRVYLKLKEGLYMVTIKLLFFS